MEPIKFLSFSDFPAEGYLEGEKKQIEEIKGQRILFTKFIVMTGKLRTDFCLKVQFKYTQDSQDLYYFYTGSGVVRDQLERLADKLPLWGTLTAHKNTNGRGNYLCIE